LIYMKEDDMQSKTTEEMLDRLNNPTVPRIGLSTIGLMFVKKRKDRSISFAVQSIIKE